MSEIDNGEDLKTRVAWLYYVEGMTQDEVAQQVGLNRARVLRILANARNDGTVQIRVTTKLSECVELERKLEEVWGLEKAIVVPTPRDARETSRVIGQELGGFISANVRADMTIGLGWGETLTRGVPAIEPSAAKGVKVISLLGGLTRVENINPSEFAWRVADKLEAECFMMAGPVFAPDCETRDALMKHSGISEVVDKSSNLDMAILSLGDLTPHSVFVRYGLLSAEEINSLEMAGAVGDVLCRFVDAEGNIVDHPVNDRVFAVHPHDLRRARKIVLASGGWHKVKILRASLQMLHPAVLITDVEAAQRLVMEG